MSEKFNKLYLKYKPWFEDALWGFECEDGWYDLLCNLCEELEPLVELEQKENPEWEFKVLQVKEKY